MNVYPIANPNMQNTVPTSVRIYTGEFCFANRNGIPIISNNIATTNHNFATARLYFIVSVTSGGFTPVKNPTGFFERQSIIPITIKTAQHTLQIIKAIIIIHLRRHCFDQFGLTAVDSMFRIFKNSIMGFVNQ